MTAPESAAPSGPSSPSPLFATPSSDLEDYFDARISLDGSDDTKRAQAHRDAQTELPERPKPINFVSNPCCTSSHPLIKIVSLEEMIKATAPISRSPKILDVPPANHGSRRTSAQAAIVSMVYNEYGELVDPEKLNKAPVASELTTTGILRILKKAYHHHFRSRNGDIIMDEMRGKLSLIFNDGTSKWEKQCSSWLYEPPSPKVDPVDATELHSAPTLQGQPRVLELGCGDGTWCIRVKAENQNWLVDGIDDTNHWLCVNKGLVFRDFMEVGDTLKHEDYFCRDQSSECLPEFNVRNLNALIDHVKPIPKNLYGLIRGRDIFDRVESYANFLDTVRLILQPEGVVEFLEVDPRPRTVPLGPVKHVETAHKSGPDTTWTNKIADRFKEDVDPELATTGWTARVDARLKAQLRPRDGVAAANLKNWLEGAGFYDVKQWILRLPIGGDTLSGQRLKTLILERIELEDSIPKLKAELPSPELDEITSGKYHFNLHIVTGRKPPYPRTGDLLSDGTRQEMTASTYDAMARFNDAKSSQWKRFDLDSKLTAMLESLTTPDGISVARPLAATITRGTATDGLIR